jgi:hypothetical protein
MTGETSPDSQPYLVSAQTAPFQDIRTESLGGGVPFAKFQPRK